jgi:transposase
VPLLPTSTQLSHAQKDALIAALTALLVTADERIAAQDARIAALARLNELTRPPKTPDNSSKPPSQGQKEDRQASGTDRPARKSRPGVGRTLHPHPDRTIDRRLATCPNCAAVFPDASQTPQQIYERIELPPIRPDVTQVRLFGGRCACAVSGSPPPPRPDWSRVRRSATPSRRWWCICIMPMPSAWNDWPS